MNIPDFLDPAVPTIMRQLKQAGYVTALYGKWHMTTYDPPRGDARAGRLRGGRIPDRRAADKAAGKLSLV